MRASAFAAVGIFASGAVLAHAEPELSASGFVGIDWFGAHTELGNSWAPEQVPGTSPLVGGRLSWLALPALPARLSLAVETELAIAPAFTGGGFPGGRMVYFAPVFEWRAHARLSLARWSAVVPHLVLGGGGETVASTSPFMSKETDPVAYWGAGISVPITAGRSTWHLRIDARHGVMPARNGGINSTFELQLGLGTTFGLATATTRRPTVPPLEPAASVAPIAPVGVNDRDRDGDGIPDRLDACPDQPQGGNAVIGDDGCPEPDPDGDGIIGDADRCPDQAEDFDGWQDADGCPDPDNDHDGIEDRRDVCPGEPETVNGWQDADGCPDQLPVEITAALATAVHFERGRARINRNAAAALRPVLAMLEGRPELRLAIIGHPERPGGDDLARRRAEAVKWYLVDQGVIEDRLETRVGEVSRAPAIAFELALAGP